MGIRWTWVFKAVAVIIAIFVALLFSLLIFVKFFDNSELKPSKDHVTDYVSPTSPYAVQVLYDENHHPVDIVIVKAKSGVTVAGIDQDAFDYKITETSSTMKFVLYDNEGVEMGTYIFDTKTGEWIR